MSDLNDVLARLANEPSFADALRTDPAGALRGYQLDAADLTRLERMVGSPVQPPAMFADGGDPAVARAERLSGASTGVVAGGLAVVGAAVGLGLGAIGVFGGGGGGNDGPSGEAGAGSLRVDAAAYYSCSDDNGVGAPLGDLHRGDEVWVIGRSGDSWLVIRNPRQLTTPAWMRADTLIPSGDTSGFPELTCSTASAAALPSGTTLPPDTTVPPDTTLPATTTLPGPTTTTGPAPTTLPPDTTGPTVTIVPDRTFVYDGTTDCPDQTVDVTVQATDPSAPVTITSVTWARGAASGDLQPLGGNRFRIPAQTSGPATGAQITITATATDGRGNATTTSVQIDYLDAAFPPCTPG